MRISKIKIRKLLKKVKLKWDEDSEQYLIDYWPDKPELNDAEYDTVCVQGHDSSGSSGTEEQSILNMIRILDGEVPDNIKEQITTMPILGWRDGDYFNWPTEESVGPFSTHQKTVINPNDAFRKRVYS